MRCAESPARSFHQVRDVDTGADVPASRLHDMARISWNYGTRAVPFACKSCVTLSVPSLTSYLDIDD